MTVCPVSALVPRAYCLSPMSNIFKIVICSTYIIENEAYSYMARAGHLTSGNEAAVTLWDEYVRGPIYERTGSR